MNLMRGLAYMESQMMFLDCPAYFDEEGSMRCALPAEVEYRYTLRSTGGLLEGAKIRCPRGHWFNGPIESLTLKSTERGASPIDDHSRQGER
jgi:hypothetical protein